MERSSLSNNLKHHSLGGRSMKDSWDSSSDSVGGDILGGFSWPPRSYTCSFCKREFRSAQALGGHMNVHRRDRARLRQSPPRDGNYSILNLNLDPNPNPNFSSSSHSPISPSKRFPPFTSSLPPLVSPSISSLSSPSSASPSEIKKWCKNGADLGKIKTTKTLFGVGEFDSFRHEKECKAVKKAEIVRLDLEIGLLSDSKLEDLDLELRLGYS